MRPEVWFEDGVKEGGTGGRKEGLWSDSTKDTTEWMRLMTQLNVRRRNKTTGDDQLL